MKRPVTASARRRAERASGYSLPEMILVAAIASAVMVSAIPNAFALFHRYTLWVAAYELASELQQARAWAVASNTSISLSVDVPGGSYQLVDPTGAPVAAPHYLPKRIRFESLPRTALRFHARGTAAPAGSITLAGPAGQGRVVVGLSGRVRIEWKMENDE